MTWSVAKAQIISMIATIPASSFNAERRETLEHDTSLFSKPSGQTGRFAVRGVSAATRAVATGSQSRRTQQDADLAIDFMAEHDDDALDSAIWTVYETVRERLLDTTQWNRPTSTIEALTLREFDMDASTEDATNEDGALVGRRLTIQFTVSHTEQTS